MVQGDSFTDGGKTSVSANSTYRVDITAASGDQIKLDEITIGHYGFGTTGHSHAFKRDVSAGVNYSAHHDLGEKWFPYIVGAGDDGGTNTAFDNLLNAAVLINDTIGVRFEFDNKSCNSGDAIHAVSGIQVK